MCFSECGYCARRVSIGKISSNRNIGFPNGACMDKKGVSRLYHIPVLSKALDILEFLQTQKPSASLEELYRETQFSKTTVYRILRTLEHRGYLARQDDGRYRLVSRPSKLRFGFAGQSATLPFSQAVTASLKEAAASSGVALIVLDNQ